MAMLMGADPALFSAPSSMSVPAPPPAQPSTPAAPFLPYGQREPRVDTIAPASTRAEPASGFSHALRRARGLHRGCRCADGLVRCTRSRRTTSTGDGISDLGAKHQGDSADGARQADSLSRADAPPFGPHRRTAALPGRGRRGAGGRRRRARAEQTAQATFSLSPDVLSGRQVAPAIRVVGDRHVIADREREVQLLKLPDGNPKADDYLMVYLPKQRILYTTAFIYPVPEAVFPPKESIDLSIYFVQWLDRSGSPSSASSTFMVPGSLNPGTSSESERS